VKFAAELAKQISIDIASFSKRKRKQVVRGTVISGRTSSTSQTVPQGSKKIAS
jgi:hypothetical protein